jgi:F-type H+-transporting ATPase subunit b
MLKFDPGLIIWTILIFLLLVALLRKLAWKPLLDALEERTRRIKDSLDKAEAAKQAAEQARTEYETMMAKARQESQELIAKSRKTAEATREEIITKAQIESEQLTQRVKKEIDLARQKALDEIKHTAAELSINIATRIIGKSLGAKDHQELIRQALSEIQTSSGEPN